MREIKFRGKRINNSGWIYGDIHKNQEFTKAHIHPVDERIASFDVMPATVGQFTGLLDKNEVEIYEGDIVQVASFGANYKVEYSLYGFRTSNINYPYANTHFLADILSQVEVIGNIHDSEVQP